MRRHHFTRPGSQHGFTLMELMITVVVLAILVSIAYPSYQDQIRKARRAPAMICLTEMANRQELFFADNFRYTTTLADLPHAALCGDGGYYQVSVSSRTITPPTFTVRAQTVAGKDQHNDTNCRAFTLTNSGVRGSVNAGGAPSTGCWVSGE